MDDYDDELESNYGSDDDLEDYNDDQEMGDNFKDAERAGGLGGVIGTKDSIYNQQEYNIKRTIDVATHEPFNMKITEDRLDLIKDIFNVKIRNPFMIACILKWDEEGYSHNESSLESFAKEFFGAKKKELKIDFVRYLQLVKK